MFLGRLRPHTRAVLVVIPLSLLAGFVLFAHKPSGGAAAPDPRSTSELRYLPRKTIGASGYGLVTSHLRWRPSATLDEIAGVWHDAGSRLVRQIDGELTALAGERRVRLLLAKSVLCNYSGDPDSAAEALDEMRSIVEADDPLAVEWLFTIIFCQGASGLRLGENENCVRCCTEGSCVLPLSASAVHGSPAGSRRAIRYFSEYLEKFPGDLEVRWLLNLAHMTLGEHPARVDPRYLIRIDRFAASEFDIGRFADVSAMVGLGERRNWAPNAHATPGSTLWVTLPSPSQGLRELSLAPPLATFARPIRGSRHWAVFRREGKCSFQG